MRQRALEPLEIFVCFRKELAGHAESDAVHGQEHRSGSRDQRLEVVVEVGDLVGQRPELIEAASQVATARRMCVLAGNRLGKVFTKLAITSRARLEAALPSDPGSAPPR
jgi:hypothetical protein